MSTQEIATETAVEMITQLSMVLKLAFQREP